ncbi:MAG: [protein-PII] uridylyltransferase [Pseudomonadota bacterium]
MASHDPSIPHVTHAQSLSDLPFSDAKNTQFDPEVSHTFTHYIERFFSNTPLNIPNYKQLIHTVNEFFNEWFSAQRNIEDLVHFKANFIDSLLCYIWKQQAWDITQHINLIAVGGYGRGELHPYSDIDILILSEHELSHGNGQAIESFLTTLWDIGLIMGHSVRTLDQCAQLAQEDITVISNLIEQRLLTGDTALLQQLNTRIHVDNMWSYDAFFKGKQHEQKMRHVQFNNTEYNLEPNIKESPGGLRDIHTISWIIKRHTHNNTLDALLIDNVLNHSELNTLIDHRNYLWRVRYALHVHNGKPEESLLFDTQKVLAAEFNFKDTEHKLAVEQFMQAHYRCSLSISATNEMVMQMFDESILSQHTALAAQDIHCNFQLVDQCIDIKYADLFAHDPSQLLNVFVIYANHPEINGMRSRCIRAIRQHVHLIDDAFRDNPEHHALFLSLLNAPDRVADMLKLMKRFGVLGAYIPAFDNIMGQTQHDLFHIYSVDAHTILLAMNLQHYNRSSARETWPILHNVIRNIDDMDALYLAAIFHDIAKGRGGDHSTLGAVDAFEFCQLHGLSTSKSKLVSWLVKKHLLMSSVSQRQDIDDPEVIRNFALEMGDPNHLDHLFVLTVADINATNKKLWNSWRASLMQRLYHNTRRALKRGLEHYIDRADWIADKQYKVLTRLRDDGINPEQARIIWDEPNNDYFLRENTDTIYKNTFDVAIHLDKATHARTDTPLIKLTHPKETNERNVQLGASRIFISMPIHNNMFAVITTTLEQLGLNVHDARIYSTRHGFSIDTYYVLDCNNKPLTLSQEQHSQIIDSLTHELNTPEEFSNIVMRRTSRQLKYFSRPTQTEMSIDTVRNCNVLEVHSPDRPGLLARIARIFCAFNIKLINVKISTLGEMIEDTFFITDVHDQAITDPSLIRDIQSAICETLDQQNNPSLSLTRPIDTI